MLRRAKFRPVSLIGLDDTRSAFGFRRQTAGAEREPASDDFSRTSIARRGQLKLPPDVKTTLKKDRKAASVFEALSSTLRREYAEWVLEAKREETRSRPIETMIGRLKK